MGNFAGLLLKHAKVYLRDAQLSLFLEAKLAPAGSPCLLNPLPVWRSVNDSF